MDTLRRGTGASPTLGKVLRICRLTASDNVKVPLDQLDFLRKRNAGPAPAAGNR
jgi:hypothetical protein